MAGRFFISCAVLALIAGLAAGCGNKGDLVLPDKRDTPPAQSDPS